MPLLARMLPAPLVVDVRAGAVAGLGALLADRRIATSGRVAVAVGPGQGDSIAAELSLDEAEIFRVPGGGHATAVQLGMRLRAGAYEAVAGIGGGKVIDVTKFAAHMAGIPMVAVATNLAHDGIASPVSSLEHESGKGSYGVAMPVAVVVDLDRVRQAPDPMGRAGIGDVISNLSAMADWELAAADTGEHVDGLAAAMARSAAHAVLNQPGPATDDEFLTVLAEALILSGPGHVRGRVEPPVQRRRPRDHARHRPALPGHRQPRRAGRRRRAVLHLPARRRQPGRAHRRLPAPPRPAPDARPTSACRPATSPRRWPSPRPPAPAATPSWSASTCPMPTSSTEWRTMPGPSLAELRAAGQPPGVIDRLNDEHWAGRLYMRKVSPAATWMFARLGWSPNAVTAAFMVCGVAAGVVIAFGGLASAVAGAALIQAYLLFDCSDGELARWSQRTSATGVYLDGIGHYLGESALLVGLGIRAQGAPRRPAAT